MARDTEAVKTPCGPLCYLFSHFWCSLDATGYDIISCCDTISFVITIFSFSVFSFIVFGS